MSVSPSPLKSPIYQSGLLELGKAAERPVITLFANV